MKLSLGTDPLILNSTKSPESPADYLFQHSINVCHVGTTVLRTFNNLFSKEINRVLNRRFYGSVETIHDSGTGNFLYYLKEALETISMGYLIHDIGKSMLPQMLLDKKESLSDSERDILKRHSFEYGGMLLDINSVRNIYVENIVKYHHSPIYNGEEGYPDDKSADELPPYVKICKLADIYSAITSRRVYGEQLNPIRAVNTIFRKYSGKDPMLQFILYAFMKEIGIYPVGSILTLKNGQMAYVIRSRGPEVIIFNEQNGSGKKERTSDKIIDLSSNEYKKVNLSIDESHLPATPSEVFEKLPSYLQELHILLKE